MAAPGMWDKCLKNDVSNKGTTLDQPMEVRSWVFTPDCKIIMIYKLHKIVSCTSFTDTYGYNHIDVAIKVLQHYGRPPKICICDMSYVLVSDNKRWMIDRLGFPGG